MTKMAAATAAKPLPVSDLFEVIGNLVPTSRAYLTGGVIVDALKHPNTWVEIEDLVPAGYLRDLEAQVSQLGNQFTFKSEYQEHCAPRKAPNRSKIPFHLAEIKYNPSAT